MSLRPFTAIAVAAIWAMPVCAWAAPCAPATAPRPIETVRAFYAAAMAGDKAALNGTFGQDFHAIDGGRPYTAAEFGGLLDYLKANHLTMTWTVNAPQETVACDVAWANWDNRGTVTDANGTKPLEWLESAVLRWQDGAWKMAFFHSSKLTPPKP